MHGGRVEARSPGAGKGSEFAVRLPILEAPTEPPKEANESVRQAAAGSKRRILIVDDLNDSVDSLALVLRLGGHEIHTAHDGLEAVQATAAFRPDVVLMDIGMPRMNGYEAARCIRQQPWGADMVLVAVTGWGQLEDKRRALEAGFDHHLTKPVEHSALEEIIARVGQR